MPTDIAATSTGDSLIVAERSGMLYLLPLGSEGETSPVSEGTKLLDIRDRTETVGEAGLLAVALSDDEDHLLIATVNKSGATEVISYPFSGNLIDPDSGTVRLRIDRPRGGHYGADIVREPGGGYYVSVGDRDSARSRQPLAQDLQSPEGAVLWIPEDEGTPPDVPALKIIAKGLRNPWRLDLDPSTGDLWVADVGENEYEEVNRIPGELIGRKVINFGWPAYEGLKSFRKDLDHPGLESPILVRRHTDSVCAITTGGVYRGSSFPVLRGQYIYGDICDDELFGFPTRGDGKERHIASLPQAVLSISMDHRGEILVATMSGMIYQMSLADVAEDTPAAPPTDASVPAPTSSSGPYSATEVAALCLGQEAWLRLGSIDELDDPNEVQATVEAVLDDMEASISGIPDELRSDAQLVLTLAEEIAARLRADQWRTDGPQLDALLSGSDDGRWADLGGSLATLGNVRVPCDSAR